MNEDISKYEIKNAKIESTMLGFEHSALSFWLMLDYGGSGQGFGGIGLDGKWDKDKQSRVSHPFAGHCITGILKAVGVERWEDLKGKHCRVLTEPGWSGSVKGIGNIIGDPEFTDWFIPADVFNEHYKEAESAA